MQETEGSSAIKEGERYSLEQWKTWPEGERWELIGGKAYVMSPSPQYNHQQTAGHLYSELCVFLKGKQCFPSIAPLDVFLPGGEKDAGETVVEPDVMVVCNKEKIHQDGIHGAPDFIAEVLSPSTAYRDMNEKRLAYEAAGVREYWIISPGTGSVFQYILKSGKYLPVREIPRGKGITSTVFPGFVWRLPELIVKE